MNSRLDEHKKVQFITVVNEECLPENGCVTPTNRIKRGKIDEEYARLLNDWHGLKKAVIWHTW
eukprot:15327133-Ditylum_brightwellii.AAC.1